MSFRERIELALKIVTICIALFGIWKYFSDRNAVVVAEQKARSLTYIDRFSSPELVEARSELLAFWKDYPKFIAFIRENEISTRAYRNFVQATYPSYKNSHEIDSALFRLLLVFDEISYCRDSGLCDLRILDDFFCSYVTRYARVYGPFYEKLSSDIGAVHMDRRLQGFARECNR